MPSFLSRLLFGMHVTNMLMDIGKKKDLHHMAVQVFTQGRTKVRNILPSFHSYVLWNNGNILSLPPSPSSSVRTFVVLYICKI